MPLTGAAIAELRRIVGRESVIDSANDLRIFERDASIEGALPDAVVLASTTKQVAAVRRVAATHQVPVVPRGAGI
jgi:glycolate oxidase